MAAVETPTEPTGALRARLARWRHAGLRRRHAGLRRREPLDRVRQMLARWRKRGRSWESRPYYPAILDLNGRTTLVVGAGEIGERKIEALLNARARVRVTSETATEEVRRWADQGLVELRPRSYETGDLDGCFLVIAATSDNETNVRVSEDAEGRNMLCNVVDAPHLCSFILPSVARHGDLAIAVSTGGASPALARKIRLSLDRHYGDEHAVAVELLGSLRKQLKARYPDAHDRKIVFERIVYSDLMDMVRAGDTERIEAWIDRCVEEGPDYASEDEHRAAKHAASADEGPPREAR